MTSYELVFITKDGGKPVLKSAEDIVKGFEGKVDKQEDWGKRTFAYKMKGHNEGFYHVWNLTVDSSQIKTLKTKLNLEEGIIRYLLMRND